MLFRSSESPMEVDVSEVAGKGEGKGPPISKVGVRPCRICGVQAKWRKMVSIRVWDQPQDAFEGYGTMKEIPAVLEGKQNWHYEQECYKCVAQQNNTTEEVVRLQNVMKNNERNLRRTQQYQRAKLEVKNEWTLACFEIGRAHV